MRGLFRTIATPPLTGLILIGLALAGSGGTALAQQSADQIINALKPTGNLAAGSTRGIKLGGAASPQAVAPAKPVAAGTPGVHPGTGSVTPAPAGAPSVNVTVNFPTGSFELTNPARVSLDALGKALASNDLATFRFRIEGHTDNVGAKDENMVLSQKRAEAVVSYLTGQYNVKSARLEAVGMGQEHPLVDTAPQTPEAKNRRVQVINLGA